MFIRHQVVLAFLACFAIILGALEAINALSRHNQGLVTTNVGRHYLWTYGPTAGKLLGSGCHIFGSIC